LKHAKMNEKLGKNVDENEN